MACDNLSRVMPGVKDVSYMHV
ncbi:protein of unknown function [Burkholderia multivorans]